jgi:hypothetical protein
MKLPVDTSAIAFLCALAPEPVVDFETRRPKADENGEPLYVIQLLAMGDGSADLLAVKVPGVPSPGHPPGRPGQGARPGCPALDDGRPLWRLVPRVQGRAGHRPSQSQLRRRDTDSHGSSGGAGRPAVGSRAGPSPPPEPGARNTRPGSHQE